MDTPVVDRAIGERVVKDDRPALDRANSEPTVAQVPSVRLWEPGRATCANRQRAEVEQASHNPLPTIRQLFSIARVEKVWMDLVSLAGNVAQHLGGLAMTRRKLARRSQEHLDAGEQFHVRTHPTKIAPHCGR